MYVFLKVKNVKPRKWSVPKAIKNMHSFTFCAYTHNKTSWLQNDKLNSAKTEYVWESGTTKVISFMC